MQLTKLERLILTNQFRILSKLDPTESRFCDQAVEILQNGYTLEYAALAEHTDKDVPESTCREVRDVLDMYRALQTALRDLPAGSVKPRDTTFKGFDGNDETEHFSYATFLIEVQGKWAESKDCDLSSHHPMLDDYRKMLSRWRQCPDKWNLTAEDVSRIVGE